MKALRSSEPAPLVLLLVPLVPISQKTSVIDSWQGSKYVFNGPPNISIVVSDLSGMELLNESSASF